MSGASTVVDTTKDPPYAFLLARVPNVDLRFVHLMRDSRGVAFSAQKTVAKPDADAFMPRQAPPAAALSYDLYNGLFHALAALGVPRLPVRYEELVERPREELRRVLAFAGSKAEVGDWLDGRTLRVDAHHSAGGNPLRFRLGPTELRADEEWRERLGLPGRLAVDALTFPFLLGYGYLGRRSASS